MIISPLAIILLAAEIRRMEIRGFSAIITHGM
jgi:hypothetical protein